MIVAVLPGTSGDMPENGNDPSLGGVGWMQDVTEAGVRQNAYNQVFPSMQRAKNSLFGNLIGGIANAISGALNPNIEVGPWFGEIKEALEPVYDGQLELNDQVDLLGVQQDYLRTFARLADRGHARFGEGQMPFTEQIGPSRNAIIDPTFPGRLQLLDKGMWEINARVVPSWTGLGNYSDLQMTVITRYPAPNGTIFAQSAAFEKTNNVTTLNVNTTVVVPEPGYTVEVMMEKCGSTRGIYGGPKFSEFNVQHLSREVVNNTGAEGSTSVSYTHL